MGQQFSPAGRIPSARALEYRYCSLRTADFAGRNITELGIESVIAAAVLRVSNALKWLIGAHVFLDGVAPGFLLRILSAVVVRIHQQSQIELFDIVKAVNGLSLH